MTGICASRRRPYVGCVFSEIDDINHLARVEDIPHAPFEVQGCGFACVLINTEILRAVMMANHGSCFLPMDAYGEDLLSASARDGWAIISGRIRQYGLGTSHMRQFTTRMTMSGI